MKEIINQIKVVAGDLICIEWSDASIGKSLSNGVNGIDVPVSIWGIFIGELGQKDQTLDLAKLLNEIDTTATKMAKRLKQRGTIRTHKRALTKLKKITLCFFKKSFTLKKKQLAISPLWLYGIKRI